MKLTYSDYLELPSPLAAATQALADPEVWSQLTGAEPLGELWRYGAELYQVQHARPAGPAPGARWQAATATGHGPRLEVELSLTDAVISTHATVSVRLELPGPRLSWRRAATGRALRRAARRASERLVALLRARAATAVAAPLAAVAVAAGGDLLAEAPEPTRATAAQLALVERLQARYPQTVEHFLAMDALEHLERVARLEQGWERILRGEYDQGVHQVGPAAPARLDFDLIYAGGGLGLLHAAVMAARHGRRVMIFDRSEVGCVHREWNISRAELAALVESGVVSWADLGPVVMREYRDGVVRFFDRHAGQASARSLAMPAILNLALDAGALLRLMRRKLEAAGGVILSGRAFRTLRAVAGDTVAVEVELEDLATGATERHTARLLLDGMGSTSPLALRRHAGRPFAGVCPTVGTVAAGFAQGAAPDEVDPERGDILVTVADAQRGEQLIWEGFPGRDDEVTVYVFYYATLGAAGAPGGGLHPASPRYSLLDLFEQYFALLPSYKRQGPDFRHLKPVYGYIPGRHSLRSHEAPLLRGVLPVGDSAAQQSPLTFCGFGSHVRNLRRTTALLNYALDHDLLEPEQLAAVTAFQTNVSLNWVFSRFMHPWGRADDVNRLQSLFLDVLGSVGPERAIRFYQDRMGWEDYNRILRELLRRRPEILLASWGVLGPAGIGQWAVNYLHFSAAALGAALARAGGGRAEALLTALGDALAPAIGLRVRARYEEWRAMGWVPRPQPPSTQAFHSTSSSSKRLP